MSLRRFFSVLIPSAVALCVPSLLFAQGDAAPKARQLFTVSPQVQHPAEQFCTHRGRRTRLQGDSPIRPFEADYVYTTYPVLARQVSATCSTGSAAGLRGLQLLLVNLDR
jgi:hypothetical protein